MMKTVIKILPHHLRCPTSYKFHRGQFLALMKYIAEYQMEDPEMKQTKM